MYTNRINLEAIRKIDHIIETPTKKQVVTTEMTSSFQEDSASSMSDQHQFSREEKFAMVEEASKALETVNTELTFRVHEGTGRPLIQLVERGTKDVVREIPPEKMLDILAGIWEWAGVMIDRKE